MYPHNLLCRNIIHRDIKLENLLKTADGYKLADFGLSVNAAEERPVTKLGTTEYVRAWGLGISSLTASLGH